MTLKYVTIHGHFYQPPRENPFLEKIERQESAHPYHDWNIRIADECYRPNTCSRILDSSGKIIDIVNNFEYLNFDIGSTLINWLKEYNLETYQRIIDADKRSMELNNGHGNALAQVYNHIIMPLADKKDQITQIRWGIDDFKHHFGRMPEGMWLAETGINLETVKLLIDQGIKFTVLSPFQAEKVKGFFDNNWKDVTDGSIDPTQPYRIYPYDEDRSLFLDVFFYDAPISSAVSFEHLLKNSHGFADRLNSSSSLSHGRPALINISTDGESYGHHEPFGDMCLAYFFKVLAPKYNFKVINYANFLNMYSPTKEVVLKTGSDNNGTAWSCSHGVGRWKEDCGCSTGAPADWNQKWRKPLREGLNTLRDECWDIYHNIAEEFFQDTLDARNNYYKLFSGIISEKDFWKQNLKIKVNEPKKVTLLKLLESQRYSQLMFTSCAWFFADISGIETVQVIKYAHMAAQYAGEFSEKDLGDVLRNYLLEADSNLGESHSGKTILDEWVRPYDLTAKKAINQYLNNAAIFKDLKPRQIYLFDLQPEIIYEANINDEYYIFANIKTKHLRTKEEVIVSAVCISKQDKVETFVSDVVVNNLEEIHQKTCNSTDKARQKLINQNFPNNLGLKDLNFEESSKVMDYLWDKQFNKLIAALYDIYGECDDLVSATIKMGGFIPHEIKIVLQDIMSAKYYKDLIEIKEFTDESIKPLKDTMNICKSLKLDINKEQAKTYLAEFSAKIMQDLYKKPTKANLKYAFNFLRTIEELEIIFNKTDAENMAFDLFKSLSKKKNQELNSEIIELSQMLNVEIDIS